jgi:hypothetical protein
MEFKASIKLEKLKDTDYGSKRYTKQLVKAIANDPEALRIIILTNLLDCYFGDAREELEPILENQENERAAILRVAQKCTPEVFQYFSDLLAAGKSKEPNPDNAEKNREREKSRESEWVFSELMQRLCQLLPMHIAFNELPLKKNPAGGQTFEKV